MKESCVATYMLILTLAGYDNNNNALTAVKKDVPSEVTRTTSSENASSAKLSVPERQGLAQQSTDKVLTLLDPSKVQLDGAAALVLTFSIPLGPDQDSSRAIHTADKKGSKVDGAWELSGNLKELRSHHLEPKCDLIVTTDGEVKAPNNATFSKGYEETIATRDTQSSVGFASRGSLLPGKVVEGLPVTVLNVSSVDVNSFHVKPKSLPAFISQWEYRSSLTDQQSDKPLQMADLAYTGQLDLNPVRNTHEELLLPLGDIKPLQQAGMYLAVMNQIGRCDYSNPTTLFMLSDIGVSAHRCHSRLDISTQSLESGAAQQRIEVPLLNKKGPTLTQATGDAQEHVQLESDKNMVLLLARRDGQTTLLDLKFPALDLAEFSIAGAPSYSKQFFMFDPHDLHHPGGTVILNGLLCDTDGKTLLNQPIKLDVVKPDGQALRSVVSQPKNGLCHFTWPLDSNTATGMWHIRASTGDNQYRVWDSHVEDFMPERMALDLTGEKTSLTPKDEVRLSMVGYYLYGAPANGNTL